MSNHAFGRGTVAVPVFWIDTLVPHARFILQAVRVRNRMRVGNPDLANILSSLFSTWPRLSGRAAPSCCKSMAWDGGRYSSLQFVSLWAVRHSGKLGNRSSMQRWNAMHDHSVLR
ncbi:hypothetical protein WJX77_004804 [Trebouxia sp. C0004]